MPVSVRACTLRTQAGQSWSVRVELTGAQRRGLPVWMNAETWIELLTVALRAASHNGTAVRVREGEAWTKACVRIETILAVAHADAAAADRRTGRNVKTAHKTVARMLGCHWRTVQRARTIIEQLGFACTVERGRYLSTAERETAKATHGRSQRRIASTRHLTQPRPAHAPAGMKTIGALPQRGSLGCDKQVCNDLPTRTRKRAHVGAASRRNKNPNGRIRPTLAVQVLAGHLATRLPWLANRHIGHLCRTLTALGIDANGWTAHDVLDLLDRRNTTHGLYSLSVGSQRDPLAVFAHQMRAALAERGQTPTPVAARRDAEHQRVLEAERVARETAAREAQITAERHDPQVQAQHRTRMAQLRAHLHQITQPTHYGPETPHVPTGPAALRTRYVGQA